MKIYKRHDPTALMANGGRSIVGPNGKKTCRWCGVEVTPPRRSWCGDACVHEYSIRSNAGYARAEVYKRDRGRCCLCGLDCSKLSGRLRKLRYQCRRTYLAVLGLRGWRSTLWEVDHMIPVVEGGGSCGLDNLRTLCVFCHREETAKLAARRARRRRTHPKSGPTKLKSRARAL